MNFPIITDWYFYAVAISAVLLLGISKSGVVGTVVGALLFKALDAKVVVGIVGAFTLLFLAQRLLFPPRPDSAPPPRWLGGILAVTPG